MRTGAQPYYDFELAKICAWLKKRGLSMHVTLGGEVTFKELPPKMKAPDADL
jgi:hypothetical protein